MADAIWKDTSDAIWKDTDDAVWFDTTFVEPPVAPFTISFSVKRPVFTLAIKRPVIDVVV